MIVFLTYPGTFLDLEGSDAHHVQGLLYQAEADLTLASLALLYFRDEQARPRSSGQEEWMARADRRRSVAVAVRSELGVKEWDFERQDEVEMEVTRRIVTADAAAGTLPRSYLHQLPFLHAKSFLFALDGVRKSLRSLERIPPSAAAAKSAREALQRAVPDLAGVRDSTAHADERSRGLAKGKKLPNVAICDFGIEAPTGGAVVISGLHGDVFHCTLEDGRVAGVPVNQFSLMAAVQSVQGLIDELHWRGPARITPYG